MTIRIWLLSTFCALTLLSCEKNNEKDTLHPTIDLTLADAYPTNCDTLYLGDTAQIKFLVSDNAGIGSLSISIHHNFDHHSHSTELTECALQPRKAPVNPLVIIEEIPIPEGQKEYTVNYPLPMPDVENAIDTGDYHVYLSLTDITGWTTQRGVSIKVLRK